MSSIGIIGVGQVGAAAAYALVLGSIADELLLVDVKADLRDAQVRDLSDVAYISNSKTRVRAAAHHEVGQCDIVVITTGSNLSPGETSFLHMYQNVAIIRSVMKYIVPLRSDTIVLVVANPVDLITSLARELSGLPDSQVIGSGTFLDSVRLRGLLADQAGVSPKSIDLYVVGTHGSSQVAAWSTATIGGIPINISLSGNAIDRAKLENECKSRSETIIKAKGATPLESARSCRVSAFPSCRTSAMSVPLVTSNRNLDAVLVCLSCLGGRVLLGRSRCH
ncbi:hypothetical protein AWENTII_006335 [Aspergillus wentii]